jgi:hypothetical protein
MVISLVVLLYVACLDQLGALKLPVKPLRA